MENFLNSRWKWRKMTNCLRNLSYYLIKLFRTLSTFLNFRSMKINSFGTKWVNFVEIKWKFVMLNLCELRDFFFVGSAFDQTWLWITMTIFSWHFASCSSGMKGFFGSLLTDFKLLSFLLILIWNFLKIYFDGQQINFFKAFREFEIQKLKRKFWIRPKICQISL